MDYGSVENCNFTKNTATSGGAVYFYASRDINVKNCNFIGNNASNGSAVFCNYDRNYTKTFSNSIFLNNRADAKSLEVTKNENNIAIVFLGQDNLLNAIYSDGNLTFINVTYWGANGITNTGNVPVTLQTSECEAGQKLSITCLVDDILILNTTKVTDKDGKVVIEDIVAGDYVISIASLSDAYYSHIETVKTLSISGESSNLTLKALKNKVIVNAASGAIGNVTIAVKNESAILKNVNVGLNEGVAELDLSDLDYGSYNISAVYLGDINHHPDQDSIIYQMKEQPSITINFNSTCKVGENLTITIGLPIDATGNVTVKLGNETQVLEANETIVASFSNLNATTYPITVSYDGDDNYNSKTETASVTVDKGDSQVIVDSEIIADNGKIAIPFTTVNAKGVNVKVFSKSGLQILNTNCDGNFIVLNLDSGEYTLEVTTIVDDSYNPNTATASLTVNKINKINSTISITMIDGFKVTGVLKDSEGNAIANASVLCLVGDENVTATTNENGEFTVTVKNNVVLNMIFEGNSNFKDTNAVITLKNIVPQSKATQIIADNPFTRRAVDYKAGERGYMFYFTLKDEDGNALANKKVKIGIDGKIYTVTTDKDGKAGQMINMANENSYTYALSFLGDEDYKASFAVSRLIVTKKPITITPAKNSYTFKSAAKTKTITATLKSSNSYIPKGKQVTLTVAGQTFKTTVGAKGQISFNIGSITKKGTYKVAIKFAGTVTYAAANSKSITVKIS